MRESFAMKRECDLTRTFPALLALTVGVLAACTTTNSGSAENSDKPTRQDVAEATKPPAADECGARDQQSLLGKNRSAIPATPAGANWRVACTTCAVTMDYRPDRLNIFFEEKTDEIKEIKCG